jgi:hypothetical protein
MKSIKSQKTLLATFGIVSLFYLSFEVKAQNISVDLKRGNIEQNLEEKIINSDKIDLKQELKELTTEEKQQIFLGKWNLSATYNENDIIILINGFSIYREDKTAYGRYEMRIFEKMSNDIFAIITVEGKSSWWVNNNIWVTHLNPI